MCANGRVRLFAHYTISLASLCWLISLRWRHNGAIASQITCLTIVYSTVYSDANQRKHQSSVSLAFVRGIHRGPVNSPHKGPVTRKMYPFDDVIMWSHWTSKMIVRYILSSLCLRLSQSSQSSFIQYMRLCVFSLPNYLVMIVGMCTLSYYHHIRSMNH